MPKVVHDDVSVVSQETGSSSIQPQFVSSIPHLTNQQTLDMYYNVLSCFTSIPAIDRSSLEKYLSMTDNTTTLHDVNSVFYSIRALCEQHNGLLDAAEESMLLAREAVGKVFYQCSNFLVLSTYTHLSLYESGCGNSTLAKWYMNQIHYYIEQFGTNRGNEYRNLYRIYCCLKMNCLDDEDILCSFKKWPIEFERVSGIGFPQQWSQVLSQEVSEENYHDFLNIIDMLERLLVQPPVYNQVPALHRLSLEVMFNTIKIDILKMVNCDQDVKEACALHITKLTESEFFPLVSQSIIKNIATVASLHLSIVNAIEKGERSHPSACCERNGDHFIPTIVDYYEILEKDLTALRLLSTRYKKVNLFHSSLINEITRVLTHRMLFNHIGKANEEIRMVNSSKY